MKQTKIHTWRELESWLNQPRWQDQIGGKWRFAFRGQGDCRWGLKTSLARHLSAHHVNSKEWRKRELKMYFEFRHRLLNTCQGMHKEWEPWDLLSLMQHHGAPTRFLDFTHDPKVAVFFALEDSRKDSAVWVIDCISLEERRRSLFGSRDYWGPKHKPEYERARYDRAKKYVLAGAIKTLRETHYRLAAQRACLLNPGSISRPISEELVELKVTLSEMLVEQSLKELAKLGYDRNRLFPDLDQMAKEAKRSSVVGHARIS